MKPYYQDPHVTLYNGDCREILAWSSADVLVTDPPYGDSYESGWQPRAIANDTSLGARDDVLGRWGIRPALVFGRWNQPHPPGTKMVLTWDKGDWPGMGDLALPWGPSTEEIYVIGGGFNGKRSGSVVRCDRLVGELIHPNEKPVALMRSLLGKCPPGVVADPFAGSGATLRAAKDLGRKAIGVEISEAFCEVAARRLSQGVLAL